MKSPEQQPNEEVKPMTENSPEGKENQEALQARIDKALKIAVESGGVDGEHHKAWVIDQMVRELTGCPTVQRKSPFPWADGKKHVIDTLGESKEYLKLVREAREGEDGPKTYDWDTGIAP
ncbi:MAG: hypothetical protein Q7R85_01010 [bacterium]|nr:hypothetical protein [bacterium]